MKARKRPEGRHSRPRQVNSDYKRWTCDCNVTDALYWLETELEEALNGDMEATSIVPEIVDHWLHARHCQPSGKHNWDLWQTTGSRYGEYTCRICHGGLRFGYNGYTGEGCIADPNDSWITGDCPGPCSQPPHCLGCYSAGLPEIPCNANCDHSLPEPSA